jgi:hypothetical protein
MLFANKNLGNFPTKEIKMELLAEKSAIGIDYATYEQTIEQLLAEGKSSGTNHSEDYIHYTKMNLTRMKRLYKTIDLNEDLKALIQSIDRPLHFLVLAEAWCADVAQNIPTVQKMVEANPGFELSLIWRDENLDLMENYKTDGGIAIPKVIVMDAESKEELAVWGPRPEPAQNMVRAYKKQEVKEPYMEFAKKVQLWYAKDKGQTLQAEWLEIFRGLKG